MLYDHDLRAVCKKNGQLQETIQALVPQVHFAVLARNYAHYFPLDHRPLMRFLKTLTRFSA
jgi:hypothetical protein